MSSFTELIDIYITQYDSFDVGKISFDCDYGELTFLKTNNTADFILYAIYVVPLHRNQGYCRSILHHMIDNAFRGGFTSIWVQSVLSKVLYEYLERFEYNGHRFQHTKHGFLYKLT
ncbi:MAG: GNAT family N-acetyltransferase [Flavobacterium sp.]